MFYQVITYCQFFLFVQGDDTFSTQEFLSAFASGGLVQYTFQKLDNNIYLYVAPDLLDTYKNMTGSFFDTPAINDVVQKMTTMQHITISRVDPDRAQIPDAQIAAFVQNIAYMIVGFGAQKEVEAYLVYKNTQKTIASQLDTSVWKDYFFDSTIAWIVLDNIFGQAGYTSGDVLESMQYYLSSYALTYDQLHTIVDALGGSIWLFVSSDENFQLAGQVVIPNTALYPVINTILTTAKSQIVSMLWLLPEQVSDESWSNYHTYSIKPVWIAPITLRVTHDDKNTSIIWNTPTSGQNLKRPSLSKDAFAVVSVDIAKVQAFLAQGEALFWLDWAENIVPTWMQWRLQWALYQEANALHFVWQLQ